MSEESKNSIQKLLDKEQMNLSDFQRQMADSRIRITAFEKSASVLNGSSTPEIQRVFADRIRREQESIEKAKAKIRDSEVAISTFKDAMKVVSGEITPVTRDLRADSKLAKIRDLLREKDKYLPLNQILEVLGKADDKAAYRSFRGTLTQYARDGRVFAKNEAGEFGLLEFALASRITNKQDDPLPF